jgi:hypothetical protein
MMVRGVEERTARRRRGFSVKRIDAERLSAPRWRNDSHAMAPPRWTGALDRSIPPPCAGDPLQLVRTWRSPWNDGPYLDRGLGVRSRDRRMSECRRAPSTDWVGSGRRRGSAEMARENNDPTDGRERAGRKVPVQPDHENPERSTLKETGSTADHRLRCARVDGNDRYDRTNRPTPRSAVKRRRSLRCDHSRRDVPRRRNLVARIPIPTIPRPSRMALEGSGTEESEEYTYWIVTVALAPVNTAPVPFPLLE